MPGYSTIEEDFLLKSGSFEYVERVTNDAASVIKEWNCE